MHKSIDKELLYRYLRIIGNCYGAGDFEPLFPYLADDCVWESQWRLTPETGKETVMNYFIQKGANLRETGRFPKWIVVELIDNLNFVDATIAKGKTKTPTSRVGLYYEAGNLALFMAQNLDDVANASIINIKIDENDLIKRIDICMPELFKFVKYEPS